LSLFTELKRRNVLRVAVLYIAASWLILQVGENLFEILEVPMWGMRLVLGLLIIGFPIALIFSWVYEITPEGIKRETDISRDQQLATTRKLDVAVIAVVVLAAGLFAAKWFTESDVPPTVASDVSVAEEKAKQSEEPAIAVASVAVLPFVNMSGDQENEYFADGLSEELLNRLAQLPELLVAGRTSSFAFKGQNQDLREIGQKLGVANVLEGSVRRSADQVRVTAQLIRADDGFHLWSETYDRTLEDIFQVQDDIAENVAQAMDVILDEGKREHMRAAGVRNVDAFVAYQKAFEVYERAHGMEDLLPTLKRANEILDEAIRLAPDFGVAFFIQSDYYAHIMIDTESTNADRAAALEAYQTVLESAREHISDPQRRAFIDVDKILFSDDWRLLDSRIQRAISEPGCAKPMWLENATALGHAAGVYDVYMRAWECDPLSVLSPDQAAGAALWMNDADRGLEILDEVVELTGNSAWVSAGRAWMLAAQGRFDEARAEAARVPLDTEFFGDIAIVVEAAAGNLEEARRLAKAWPESGGYTQRVTLQVLAMIGDRYGANAGAAWVDAQPGGAARLAGVVAGCFCGAPFDLDATPNFRKRLEESGLPWPPPSPIKFPAKDW